MATPSGFLKLNSSFVSPWVRSQALIIAERVGKQRNHTYFPIAVCFDDENNIQVYTACTLVVSANQIINN